MHNSSSFLHKKPTHSFTKHSAHLNGVGMLNTREFDRLFMNRHPARLVRPSSLLICINLLIYIKLRLE
jgi:hypothetical protein